MAVKIGLEPYVSSKRLNHALDCALDAHFRRATVISHLWRQWRQLRYTRRTVCLCLCLFSIAVIRHGKARSWML